MGITTISVNWKMPWGFDSMLKSNFSGEHNLLSAKLGKERSVSNNIRELLTSGLTNCVRLDSNRVLRLALFGI